MQTTDKNFIDWESDVFGFGYGTGEEHTLKALMRFFSLLEDGSYDHLILEQQMGSTVAWLMLNILAHADLIEYGTSIRYGWLTEKGVALREYLNDKTSEQLYKIVMEKPDGYVHCLRDHCNCGPNGYSEVKLCKNPLF